MPVRKPNIQKRFATKDVSPGIIKSHDDTPMRCHFCQEFINTKDVHTTGMGELHIADCYLCSTDNVLAKTVSEKNKCISAHLYVGWKGGDYHCLFHLDEGYFQIKSLTTNEVLYYQDGIPDHITPQNIFAKLQTYLTFL